MKLIKLYRNAENERLVQEKMLRLLNYSGDNVEDLMIETCFYIQLTKPKRAESDTVQKLEIEVRKKLRNVIGDSWTPDYGLSEDSQFQPTNNGKSVVLVEIGPRLSYSTPWSTNCVSICNSAGISEVDRVEKAARYLIKFSPMLNDDRRKELIELLYDPMTQQIYDSPLEQFSLDKTPEKWSTVDVMSCGRKSLEEINSNMGLAFDNWDLDYYTHLFMEKIGRNPTTVELFDLAQSNSEHSRHWFFKGKYMLEGTELPESLLDMVIGTNSPATTNPNNVIKFSDNSSGIKGWKVPVLFPFNPQVASEFTIESKLRHIIFTAETHNFPTGVSPFSGATTGTGGRIRDVQAAGRGGHVIAGTAGYCFGNLHIPGYILEWEEPTSYPSNFASPLEVAIEASNGASDYGNKFGEPVICGFSRSFGMIIGNDDAKERREWIKPIMFSGGIGTLDQQMINKEPPNLNQLVVKMGGPVYRIGVGGGAASSVQVQGDNAASRDLGAVQRGDAEMEQKLNRVIRGCLEMNKNPILAIHDQGAGGNANVLKEIMEGAGGVVFTKAFGVGDDTLSTLEIWGAEYQESNAILVNPSFYDELSVLADRERCPMDKVGIITDDQKVRVYETEFQDEIPNKLTANNLPVDLELDWVLGKMPQKVFEWTKNRISPTDLVIPNNITPLSALKRVLRLPSVASKRFLTNKVDRSVTGLIAQQQCVGPLQTPLADVAVTALSYFSLEGAATSIGEQPIKILVNPEAGSRITVLEALSNLVSCLITDIKDVKCSANWMWPAKLPGEGYALYEACKAMCDIMKQLGTAVDGGKDSLSMAARVSHQESPSASDVVKAPGSLVVSTYAPCPDITKVITPDLKSPGKGTVGSLIMVKPAFNHYRLGGSALAQVYSQIGAQCPDVTSAETEKFLAAFKGIQKLIKNDLILALHDISDGGIVTCLVEMAIAGWGGFKVSLPELPKGYSEANISRIISELFNEEVGWIMEVDQENLTKVINFLREFGLQDVIFELGNTCASGAESLIEFNRGNETVLSMTVVEAMSLWEETSYQLEQHQMNRELAEEEFASMRTRKHTDYVVNFSWKDICKYDPQLTQPSNPRMAVLREEGSNGDREMVAAFIQAGFIVHDITMSDFAHMNVDLNQFRGIAFPGGFSYADVLGSGIGWSASIKERSRVNEALENWRNKGTTFSLGVCNGCQLLALLGWIGSEKYNSSTPSVRLYPNISGRYESRWSRVKIPKSNSVLLKDMDESVLGVWVAHGEGRFTYRSHDIKERIMESKCVALRYTDDDNLPTEKYPFNPNGSEDGVAGLTSECGRHLALMPHPERSILDWQQPYRGSSKSWSSLNAPWVKLFQNAFDWCLNN